MDFDRDNPVPLYDESIFKKYFNVETESMAAPGYAESKEAILRGIAATVIFQNSKSNKPDAFIPYLALNYFDRFVSRNLLPNVLGHVRDDAVLAAICCLGIAWKMRDQSFSFPEFLEKRNLNREYKDHIVVMELHILRGLNWRARAVIAICFVVFFIQNSGVEGIRRRVVNEIIIQAQGDISFTRFRPSVIAASAVIAACRLLVREENVRKPPYLRCRLKFVEDGYVREAELDDCSDKMLNMCIEKRMFVEGIEEFMRDQMLKVAGARSMFPRTSHAGQASSLFAHRPGKEPMPQLRAIREEPENENEAGMNFELKWQLVTDKPQEVSIDSTLFRPPPRDSGRNDDCNKNAEAQDKTTVHGKCGNCILL